jgi:hypothetical protein
MEENIKLAEVYGHLYTGGKEYLLLKPFPITKDGWQGDNCYRFLVTPNRIVGQADTYGIYEYPRHIVTNCFTIEYVEIVRDIYIPVSEEIDYSEYMEEEDEKELPY